MNPILSVGSRSLNRVRPPDPLLRDQSVTPFISQT
jgi:hypothetical protein